MKIKLPESKLRKETPLTEKFMGLSDLDSNLIINRLEENIKLRETPIAERLKKKLLK
jgi:hypothetical protein